MIKSFSEYGYLGNKSGAYSKAYSWIAILIKILLLVFSH